MNYLTNAQTFELTPHPHISRYYVRISAVLNYSLSRNR